MVVRRALAVSLWALGALLHRPGQGMFVEWALLAGPATERWVRVASVGLVAAGTSIVFRRLDGAGRAAVVALGAVTVGLVAGGHTAGELLHVVQYAGLAWLGGPSLLWLGAAAVDEGWEASGGAPFDVADLVLDGVGVLLVRAVAGGCVVLRGAGGGAGGG